MVNDNIAFTAIYDEKIVGFLIMKRFEESFDILRFCYVIVDDTKRGNGYGKQMMILALKYAKEILVLKKLVLVCLNVMWLHITAINQLDLNKISQIPNIYLWVKNGNVQSLKLIFSLIKFF